MATELRDNKTYRLFQKFSQESKAVSIATVALVVSTLALLLAWTAVNDARNARVMVEVELRVTRSEVEELHEQVDVLDIRYTNLLAYLKAHDIYPENKE